MAPDPLRPLLDAALEGDERALGELVRRTQASVWRLCRALGSAGDEEDVVQEVYLRALRAMPAYRGEAPVLPWLLAIALRTCADHVRRRQRQRRLMQRLQVTADDNHQEPTGSTDDLVARLDPDRRDAFVLTQVIGFSYEDAAACLGCPVGTIRSRVARARAELLTAVHRAQTR